MANSMVKVSYSCNRWFLIPSSWIFSICTFVPSNNYWVQWWSVNSFVYMSNHYSRISKHHLWCPNNLKFVIDSPKLLLKFCFAENLPNPRPKFVANPITIPFLITSVLGATTISTHVVVMTTLSDWITSIPTNCFRISTTSTSYTPNEVVWTWVWQCPILWLPIGIICGAKCGMWIHFWFFALELIGWTNLSILWS
jgi:hypothetical protein